MILSDLTEEEAYLYALMTDPSGVDQAEFSWIDDTDEQSKAEGARVFRTFPFQFAWWRNDSQKQVSAGARSLGKSLSISARAFAFPFVCPGEEMVITAPDKNRLDLILNTVEERMDDHFLSRGMIKKINHSPLFMMNFHTPRTRIVGRIPRHDGTAMQGTHPLWLEIDEACFAADTLVLTERGYASISEVHVGERVKTHTGRWKPVKHVVNHGIRDTVNVTLSNGEIIVCTPEHHFCSLDLEYGLAWTPASGMTDKWVIHHSYIESLGNSLTFRCDLDNAVSVVSVDPNEPIEVWDLEVEDDHSYVVEGIVVHNSTYPERGWVELGETLKKDNDRSRLRAHGVTMGPGNKFDDLINGSDDNFDVTRIPAMYKPTWTEELRQTSIDYYGGYESIDYKRNIKGTAEGADASLVVFPRLMSQCVDSDQMSEYNQEEYYKVEITDTLLNEEGRGEPGYIKYMIDPPGSHTEYTRTWAGMDYGQTTSDTCILIFGETKLQGEKHGRLKLLSRITMKRVPTPDQGDAILHLMSIYRPVVFAFDYHGPGRAAYEYIKRDAEADPDKRWMVNRIRGYSWSEKVIIGFDDQIYIDSNNPDNWEDAAIKAEAKNYSLDTLRHLVDNSILYIPYDRELIGEIRAVPRKDGLALMNEYNKPKKQGQHILDALRYAILAYRLQTVDETIAGYQTSWKPPPTFVMEYFG